MKLIDKDALVAEIERLRKEDGNPYFPSETADKYYARGVHFICDGLVNFLDTIEVKEVDVNKEISQFIAANFEKAKIGHKISLRRTARHFFELGLKEKQENNVIGTFEREVKIDDAGYPYIDCDFEFYGYEPGIPLAKKGDKIKIVVAKEE